MTQRLLLAASLGLAAALTLSACGGGNPYARGDDDDDRDNTAAAGAVEGPVVERTFVQPEPNQTLYKLYLRDAQNRPVKGVMCSIVSTEPTPLEVREPRRKTVVKEVYSQSDGIAAALVDNAQGQALWAVIRGEGVYPPASYTLEPAVGGRTVTMTLRVQIEPIAEIVINNPNGLRCPDAIVTFKPFNSSTPSVESSRPQQSDNYGNTLRTNGMGVVKYTRPPGKYKLIATDETGRHRLYATVNWNGDAATPLEFTLPEESMSQPADW